MLNGIDISNWQKGINISALQGVDFVIAKATEGLGYTDPQCDTFIQSALKAGKLIGFYHFARENNATAEADFFIAQTKGYQGKGIPVLDWETEQSVSWVNEWVRRYHDVTGVWPWIYGNPWRFNQGGVEPNCGRWVAAYPNVLRPNFSTLANDDPPDSQGLVCAWQFCSDGNIGGYNGNLDLDYFYGTKEAWQAYATGGATIKPVEPSKPSADVSVLENDQYRVEITRK